MKGAMLQIGYEGLDYFFAAWIALGFINFQKIW